MQMIRSAADAFRRLPQQKKRLLILSGIFYLICTALGVLFHFTFDVIGGVKLLAPFVPVNESVWEHLKLIYVPYTLILTPIEFFIYGKHTRRFIFGRLLGVVAAMCFTVMEFYTIKGAFGEPLPFVNVAIFVIATLIAYLISAWLALISKRDCTPMARLISAVLLFGLFIPFAIFTFKPPMLPLFLDETGAGYGYYMYM